MYLYKTATLRLSLLRRIVRAVPYLLARYILLSYIGVYPLLELCHHELAYRPDRFRNVVSEAEVAQTAKITQDTKAQRKKLG
jgi:hypothetical protein